MEAHALRAIWPGVACPVIGMVHLRPLPGSPRYEGDWSAVRRRALEDGRALAEGGVDGVLVENLGDAPFFAERVPPETIACVTAIAGRLAEAVPLPLGINVLRNDARSAMAIAAAVGAAFVRVNVLSGAMLTDQGLIEGRAAELLRYRRAIGAGSVRVFADARVKHAAPVVERPIGEEVSDLVRRGGADAVIISGVATGQATPPQRLREAREAAAPTPVLVGSGVTPQTLGDVLSHADGLIVGTHFHEGGEVSRPVSVARVRELIKRVAGDRGVAGATAR